MDFSILVKQYTKDSKQEQQQHHWVDLSSIKEAISRDSYSPT